MHCVGSASRVIPNAVVTVTGVLELVPAYEWEYFEPPDTREDWLVRRAERLLIGDLMVDLAPPATDDR